MQNFLKYTIFTSVFIYTSLWSQINLFFSSFKRKKRVIEIIKDEKLQKLIFDKTGVKINSVKITSSKRLFATMISIPFYPQLILSKTLYDNFSFEEKEYVVLHEAGHYKLGHGIKEFLAGLSFFVIGFFILSNIISLLFSQFMALILGLTFGVLMIQIGRLHEYQADDYALKYISDPKAMISATHKFQKTNKGRFVKYKLFEKLFSRGVPYEERIERGAKEISGKEFRLEI